jgi:hypothetical protein
LGVKNRRVARRCGSKFCGVCPKMPENARFPPGGWGIDLLPTMGKTRMSGWGAALGCQRTEDGTGLCLKTPRGHCLRLWIAGGVAPPHRISVPIRLVVASCRRSKPAAHRRAGSFQTEPSPNIYQTLFLCKRKARPSGPPLNRLWG